MRINYIAILLLSGFNSPADAAGTTQVSLSTNGFILKNGAGGALSSGAMVDGDGTVLQLGYYTFSTTSDPFAGTWVAMTGHGTSYQTTIGDSEDQGNGSFKLTVIFTAGSLGFTAPADGTPLALRFYDSTSLATSTFFNAVSDIGGGFNWIAPTDPKSTASLSFLNPVVWQDGSKSAFLTTIPVPEPSSIALVALLGGSMLAVRCRSK